MSNRKKKTKPPPKTATQKPLTQLEAIVRRCDEPMGDALNRQAGSVPRAYVEAAEDRENLRRRVLNVRADLEDLIRVARGIISSLEADLQVEDDGCPF